MFLSLWRWLKMYIIIMCITVRLYALCCCLLYNIASVGVFCSVLCDIVLIIYGVCIVSRWACSLTCTAVVDWFLWRWRLVGPRWWWWWWWDDGRYRYVIAGHGHARLMTCWLVVIALTHSCSLACNFMLFCQLFIVSAAHQSFVILSWLALGLLCHIYL